MSDESSPNSGAEQVEALLRRRLGRRVWELRVLIQDGCLVLQGYAVNYHTKQLAQHLAMEAVGLPVRANEIQVR
jgi:hypothetical protein